jgi:hypothetical protein
MAIKVAVMATKMAILEFNLLSAACSKDSFIASFKSLIQTSPFLRKNVFKLILNIR